MVVIPCTVVSEHKKGASRKIEGEAPAARGSNGRLGWCTGLLGTEFTLMPNLDARYIYIYDRYESFPENRHLDLFLVAYKPAIHLSSSHMVPESQRLGLCHYG